MERANLLNMAKLSIKGLIESALSFGRTLDSDYPPLQQFFVVMEHCLKHGLKGKHLASNLFTLMDTCTVFQIEIMMFLYQWCNQVESEMSHYAISAFAFHVFKL